MACKLDLVFHLLTLPVNIIILLNNRSPSMTTCQIDGFVLHFLAGARAAIVAGMAVERYLSSEGLRPAEAAVTAPETTPVTHTASRPLWRFVNFIVTPLIMLHSALPWLTEGGYGAYGMKPNASHCFAASGAGDSMHDMYVAVNLVFMVACLAVAAIYAFRSHRAISGVITATATQERKDLLYVVLSAALFVVTWGLFAALTIGVFSDSPAWLFDVALSFVVVGTSMNPVLRIFCGGKLREQLRGYIKKQRRRSSITPGSSSSESSEKSDSELAETSNTEKQADSERSRDALFGDKYKYLPFEMENLANGKTFLESTKLNGSFEIVNQSNSLVMLEKRIDADDDEHPVLKATAVIRAPLQDVALFLHAFDSRFHLSQEASAKGTGDGLTRERRVVEINENSRSHTSYTRYESPGFFRDRSLLTISTCGKIMDRGETEKSLVYTTMSTSPPHDSEEALGDNGCVNASRKSVFMLTSAAVAGEYCATTVQLYTQFDFKLMNADLELNRLSLPLTVRAVSEVHYHFTNRLLLSDLSPDDGATFAFIILDKMAEYHVPGSDYNKRKLARLAVGNVTRKSKALRQISTTHRWFAGMVRNILELRIRIPSTVMTELRFLSAKDGPKMGDAMGAVMIGAISAEAAVDEWIRSFPAMIEFDEEQIWFRSFMNTLVKRQLQTADFGMVFRVTLGAVLASADTISDVVMTNEYFNEGRSGLAWATLGMLLVCLILQLTVVYFQNRGGTKKVLARELLLTAVFMKPAADAWKLANGHEQEAHHIFTPLMENIFTKSIEIVAESIPGGVIQMYAIISSSKQPSTTAVASIAMSVALTGYTSAMIGYDKDTDPSSRKDKGFYGYVPDHGRLLVLMMMMLLGALQFAIKALGYALLFACGKGYAWKYALADMAFYMFVKVVRDDFWYWVKLDGVIASIISGLIRAVVKVVTDFTGCIQMRHPYEMGGAHWLFNLGVGHISTLASVYLYTVTRAAAEEEGEGGGREREAEANGLSDNILWICAVCLSLCFFLVFAAFLACINQDYLHTFVDLSTGKKCSQAHFKNSDDPEVKLYVLQETSHHIEGIRDEVKVFVLENYELWETEKPAFWKQTVKDCIPADMVPERFSKGLGKLRKAGRVGSQQVLANLIELLEVDDDDDSGSKEGDESQGSRVTVCTTSSKEGDDSLGTASPQSKGSLESALSQEEDEIAADENV
jgi:hypothetical protein